MWATTQVAVQVVVGVIGIAFAFPLAGYLIAVAGRSWSYGWHLGRRQYLETYEHEMRDKFNGGKTTVSSTDASGRA